MQLPITIGLHRSFILEAVLFVTHLLAASLILVFFWSSWGYILLFAGLGCSMVLFLRRRPINVSNLRLFEDGHIEYRLTGAENFFVAKILPELTVHPWLIVIRLKIEEEGSVAAVLVLPDSSSVEHFRCLRVWLRWRAEFIVPKNAA